MSKVQLITERLQDYLLPLFPSAKSVYILTSFAMKSGVELLKESLKEAASQGADIKICTGDYLYVTQPEALTALINIHPDIEVRLWRSNGISFHPKAYIIETHEHGTLIVGSSNLSRSALTSGIEWNLSMEEEVEPEVYEKAVEIFLKDYFYSSQTIPVNQETIKSYQNNYERYHQKHPNLVRTWTELEEVELMLPSIDKDEEELVVKEVTASYKTDKPEPRFAQIEALANLQATLEEGYDRALVVMATGLGKTYLAGFFAQNFERVLFIAHREEILQQAKDTFLRIMPDKTAGIYNGKEKTDYTDFIFASIFTLSRKEHILKFKKDEFDLIIIDEFHHAAAQSYQNVLEFFKPRFLLGITATPDRNDNKDVYAICDGNVAYRIDFLEAIQRQWLSPFVYYGVYDDTDYSQITWLGNKYDEEELAQVQIRDEMAENILQAWLKYKQKRTLVFCSSIRQAEFLSNYFNKKGFQTIPLHSQQKMINRQKAIHLLENGAIDAIFTVDLFNEGVDIPSVDTLLFVRPTESLTVFTQQVGRGLRLHPKKEKCVIIDLIGNYRNADVKLSVFHTGAENDKKWKRSAIAPGVPERCEINLDLEVINLLEEMSRKRQPRKERLLNDYYSLKQDLGRRPTYLELHLRGHSDSKSYKQEFGSYFGFLYWADELTEEEKEVFKRYENWLIEVDKTVMSKSYKMVLLKVMLDRGMDHWYKPITLREAAPGFYRYLTEKEYRKKIDFSDKTGRELWDYNEEKVSKLIARMPMTKWSNSSKGLIIFQGDNFKLNFDIAPEDNEILYNWTKQICEYRLHYYFQRKYERKR